MSKITKKDLNERLLMVETLLGLHRALPEQISNDQANNAIFRMQCALSSGKELAERKPQLKQLDQSVFDGLDEKWRFAAVNEAGEVFRFTKEPKLSNSFIGAWVVRGLFNLERAGVGYDASNWQNSLIERDIAKELLDVDLSSELTGSELCKAMLARGDTRIMCKVYDIDRQHDITHVIRAYSEGKFHTKANRWTYAVPINNQGEPLTASEAGF